MADNGAVKTRDLYTVSMAAVDSVQSEFSLNQNGRVEQAIEHLVRSSVSRTLLEKGAESADILRTIKGQLGNGV